MSPWSMKRLRLSHYFKPLVQQSRSRLTSHSGVASYRIGSVPQRFRSRPPSAIAITTRISSGRGASATDTVIVSKCGKDQESSFWPSGTPSKAPAAATLTFDPITAFRPPIARPEPVKRIYLRTGGEGGKKPPGERQYAQTFEGTAEERLAYAGLPRFTVAASTKPPTRRPTRLHVVLGDPLLE